MLKNLPSVNDLLDHAVIRELIDANGRSAVLEWVRDAQNDRRSRLVQQMNDDGDQSTASDRETLGNEIAVTVAEYARQFDLLHVRNVINATGVVLHTGLGRAPLSAAARQALHDAASACNCEIDLETGDRRYRGYQLEKLLRLTTGCETSLIVNNNAAATLLTLQSLCAGREVIISRGELIEIGGSFRLPEIFELSGAKLREVGTTNRTKLSDYERAINDDTAAIMHVHTSNYRVVGFCEKPSERDMFQLARERGLVAIDDIGSGALFDVTQAGLPEEPTFSDSIQYGADVVLGSGDKLLGGPQCGIVIGRRECVSKLRKHPLARAVRVDKLTLAALNATLEAYLRGTAETEIPTISMLKANVKQLHERAESVAAEVGPQSELTISVREDTAQVGGGSLPAVELPTFVLTIRHRNLTADELAKQLRTSSIPVFARIQKDEVILDLRSVLPEDDSRLALAVRLIRSS